jgi:hypothetical protein
MFNLADCPFQRGFSRGRSFKQLGAKVQITRNHEARGPGRFRFSTRKRHTRVSHIFRQTKTFSQLEASV